MVACLRPPARASHSDGEIHFQTSEPVEVPDALGRALLASGNFREAA